MPINTNAGSSLIFYTGKNEAGNLQKSCTAKLVSWPPVLPAGHISPSPCLQCRPLSTVPLIPVTPHTFIWVIGKILFR